MFFGRAGGIGTAGTFGIFGSINTYTTQGEAMAFGRAGCVLRGSLTNISPSTINDNTWHNSTITWDGTTARAYFDGVFYRNVFVGTANLQTSEAAWGSNSSNFSNSHRLEGSVSSSLIYDRSLSASEVLQNFNAIRGRYGV